MLMQSHSDDSIVHTPVPHSARALAHAIDNIAAVPQLYYLCSRSPHNAAHSTSNTAHVHRVH